MRHIAGADAVAQLRGQNEDDVAVARWGGAGRVA